MVLQQFIDEVVSDAFKSNDAALRGKILQCQPEGLISQEKNDTRIDLITSIYSVYWNTGGSRLVEEYGR